MLALEFARLPSAAHACRVCKRATSSQSLPDHIGFDFNKRWDDVTATSVMEGGDRLIPTSDFGGEFARPGLRQLSN
jgi:hypothetical protein